MANERHLVLVVEDNPITLKMVRIALESEGYGVIVATDGRSALMRLREYQPALILQDLLLPDVHGMELTARIRQLPGGQDIPIIAMSGLVSSQLEESDFLRAGFTDYVFKPVGVSQLLEIVASHLPAGPAGSPKAGRARILLVDDDPAQRKLQKLRLEHAGFEVEAAEDGIAALESARATPPDAVVSDLLMPRMNGLDFCLALRQDPQLTDIPVVLTSATFAEVEEADLALARSVGANTIVVRTPSMMEVIAAVHQVLRPDAPHAMPPTAPAESLQRQTIDRFIRQLERQASISAGLARRSAIAAAQVSIMSGAAEVLASRSDLSATLNEVLRRALDAGGVSAGAIYLLTDEGDLELRSHVGFGPGPGAVLSDALRALGMPPRDPAQAQPVRIPAGAVPTKVELELLGSTGMQSIMVSPLVSGGECQGVLVMASSARPLGHEWTAAVRAIGVQLAQAVAVTRTLVRLSESEQRYRGLFDGAPIGLYRSSPDGRVIDANATLVQVLGFPSREALLAAPESQIFAYPSERERWRAALESQAEVREFEMRSRRADGGDVWVENTARAVRDGDGRLLYYEGAILDITERRLAQEELRAAQLRLQEVVRASRAVIYVLRVVDARVMPIWVSENITELMGYTVEEALSHDWWHQHLHPEDREQAASTVEQLTAERPVIHEFRFRRKDGSYRWIMEQQRLMSDPAAAAREVVATWIDVTERRVLEAQLIQAQKMEAVGNLAGGVAHDFNNLLTVITGLSDLLLSDLGETHPAYRDIQEISNAAERAAALTRQLLAFSRQQVLQPQVLDLNALTGNLEKMLRRLLRENLQLTVTLDPGLGRVHADPGQIEQVLVNLVVNARDAIPADGRITIATSNLTLTETQTGIDRDLTAGDYVALTVSDTGVGMDEQTKRRIFEPFFTTKPVGKGTGLGLATVYGIVQQSGGSILVESEPGQGSAFRVLLPRVELVEKTGRGSTSRAEGLPHGSETILLVEDDSAVRKAARTILERLGYHVLAPPGPAEAIEMLKHKGQQVHLLLTDVVMPGMSGPELSGHVSWTFPAIKVLYTSGYPGEAITEHGVLVEGASFLPKPFTPNALARKVREVLDEA